MSVAVAITPASAQYGTPLSIAVTGASVATGYTLTLRTPNGITKSWDITTDGSGAFTQLYPINERGSYSATLYALPVVDASVGAAKGV